MSAQPCSPIMSMALRCSPADRYISAAARGSLLLFAQSACLVIKIRELFGSVAPTKSCRKKTHSSNHTEIQTLYTQISKSNLKEKSKGCPGQTDRNYVGQGRDRRYRVTQTAGGLEVLPLRCPSYLKQTACGPRWPHSRINIQQPHQTHIKFVARAHTNIQDRD